MAQSLPLFDNSSQNLSMTERAISTIAGLALAAAATKPRPNPWLNVVALIGGSYLAIRGATGRDPFKPYVLRLLSRTDAAKAVAAPMRTPAKRRTKKAA